MPTVALPVTAGTARAAGVHPDYRPNEQGATPFASLLDTGVTPKIPDPKIPNPKTQERPTTRADRPQRPDKPARTDDTDPAPARPSTSNDATPATAKSKTEAELEAKNLEQISVMQDEVDIVDVVDAIEPEKGEQAEGDTDTLDVAPVLDALSIPATTDASVPVTTAAPVVTNPVAVAVPVQPSVPGVVATTDTPEVANSGEAVDAIETVAAAPEKDAGATPGPELRPTVEAKVAPKPEAPAETAKSDKPAAAEDPEAPASKEEHTEAAPAPKAPVAPPEAHHADGEQHERQTKTAAEKSTREAAADKLTASMSVQRSEASSVAQSGDGFVPANNPLPPTLAASPQAATAYTQASAQAAPVPVSGLAVEIVTQAKEGKNRFEIRLDPPELGRIDVRLDVDGQGNVTSRLVVERQDTLDLLRRESSALERALNDAGLKTSNDGLQFSLRDQGFNGDTQRDGSGNGRTARLVVPTDAGATADPSSYRLPRIGGLDIRV